MTMLLLFASLLACSTAPEPSPSDEKHNDAIESAKVELDAAMDEARSTLPVFWEHYDAHAGDRDEHSLKVELPTDGGTVEQIWVDHVEKDEFGLTGKLANEPADLGDKKFGDEVSFSEDQIRDWSITVGGLMYGHFTTRVAVKRLPPEQAAGIAPLLSKTPLPQ